MFEPWTLVVVAAIGLIAGLMGGMTGIGGSLIMIPGLVMVFGQGLGHPGLAGQFSHLDQHLYQAAAMIVNVFVAIPATVRHLQARAVVPQVLKWMIPASILFILLGVWVSNWTIFKGAPDGGVAGPVLLGRLMALFLLYVVVINAKRLLRPARPVNDPIDLTYVTGPRCTAVGGATGFVGGLLGLGGGGVAVPLQQLLLHLRLRNAIANSAAAMCLTSVFGAAYKNLTLAQHALDFRHSLILAALLAPTAMIGGYVGGWATHVLPVRAVRLGFTILMALAAWKMLAI